MAISLKIEIESARVEALLQRFIGGLRERTPMNEQVGLRGAELTRNHLSAIAQTRHRTAQALGAAPTGFWAQGAEKTSSTADEEGATISINQPGIGRVAHDVTIAPGGGKKYLTIPAIADAYGKLARTFPDLTPMIRWKDGERRAVALGKKSGTGKEATFTVFYWLVKNVFQPQDRTLLPSDEEYRLAALAGVRDYVDFMLAGG
jgi:hypothetical protein